MNEVEQKYCSCIGSLRRRGYSKPSAHAICTNSVYGSRGLTRQRMVACKLERMSLAALRALAAQRGLRVTQRVVSQTGRVGSQYLPRARLIKRLIYRA